MDRHGVGSERFRIRGQGDGHSRRRMASFVVTLLVTFAAGLLFGAAASSARVQGTRSEATLTGLVQERQEAIWTLEDEVGDLRAMRDGALDQILPDPVPEPERALARTALTGPAVVVTLDDAPPDFQLDDQTNPNAVVVHQQDVDAVMNALWAGGAEAMTVQDVRITAGTPVRCVGNVILVGARSYSPPYRIVAIGDTEGMIDALDSDSSVTLYREDAARYHMGWGVQVVAHATIPAASELSPLQFSTVTGG